MADDVNNESSRAARSVNKRDFKEAPQQCVDEMPQAMKLLNRLLDDPEFQVLAIILAIAVAIALRQ